MNECQPTQLSGRSAIPRRATVAVAVMLALAACGGDGGDATTAPVVDGGDAPSEPAVEGADVSTEPTVDGGDASPEPTTGGDDTSPEPTNDGGDAVPDATVNDDDDGGGSASTASPVYCDIVLSIAAVDFTEPLAIIEATVLNAQYIVALVEEGPDQADELFGDMVELAERVGDIDPATMEPVLKLFPFDDPDDPELDDLDPAIRQHADDLIAFQSMLSAADPEIGEELEAILEMECADVLAEIELRTTTAGE